MDQLRPAVGGGSTAAQPEAFTSLVIVTDLDGTLRDRRTGSCDPARAALAMLASRDIPVVLVADEAAGDLLALQGELGFRSPFVCDGGGAVYVPHGYFPDLPVGEPSGQWHVIRFDARDAGHAIRLLISLYRAWCADPVVVVGLGDDSTDRPWLSEVDVPVIVRNDAVNQVPLRRQLPAAYVTTAVGPAGWSEAILGSVGT